MLLKLALYQQMLPAVRRNYEKAQGFIDPLGWIWTHHLAPLVRTRRGRDHGSDTHNEGRDLGLDTEKDGRDRGLDTPNVLDTHPGHEADSPGEDVLGARRG